MARSAIPCELISRRCTGHHLSLPDRMDALKPSFQGCGDEPGCGQPFSSYGLWSTSIRPTTVSYCYLPQGSSQHILDPTDIPGINSGHGLLLVLARSQHGLQRLGFEFIQFGGIDSLIEANRSLRDTSTGARDKTLARVRGRLISRPRREGQKRPCSGLPPAVTP